MKITGSGIATGLITGIVLLGMIAYGAVTLSRTNDRVNEAARRDEQLREQIEQLQESNASLRYAIEHKDDPATIEDIAREKLGLVMPDERIYYDSGE